jgi:hypothetical protein
MRASMSPPTLCELIGFTPERDYRHTNLSFRCDCKARAESAIGTFSFATEPECYASAVVSLSSIL